MSEGDYRVEAVAEAEGRIDTLRLTLQPLAADSRGFHLLLPKRALADRSLAAGDLIHAQIRPYGVEFRRGDSGKAFYLVLAEGWQRDMETRPVAF